MQPNMFYLLNTLLIDRVF